MLLSLVRNWTLSSGFAQQRCAAEIAPRAKNWPDHRPCVHAGAWRYPGAAPSAGFDFAWYRRFAAALEAARFDAIFLADSLALPRLSPSALARNASATSFEPLTLLSALAPLTSHIGLIATASTTYNEPYHVARKFASLDHLSGGRAGWNLVTSGNPSEALNFGLAEHVETVAEARAKLATLDGLVHPGSALAALSVALGHVDLSGIDLDGPLPELPETAGSKSSRERVLEVANERGLSVRLAQHVCGSYGSLELVGTAASVADEMQAWLDDDACDGFNVLFPYVPGGLDDVTTRLVPELRHRGLFRSEYPGTTLRENLGLPRPKNRHFG